MDRDDEYNALRKRHCLQPSVSSFHDEEFQGKRLWNRYSTDNYDPLAQTGNGNNQQEPPGASLESNFLDLMSRKHSVADIGTSCTQYFLRMPDNRYYRIRCNVPVVLDGTEFPWLDYKPSTEPRCDWVILTHQILSGINISPVVFVVTIPCDTESPVCQPYIRGLGFANQPFFFPSLRYGCTWTPLVYRFQAANYYTAYHIEFRKILSFDYHILNKVNDMIAKEGTETMNSWSLLAIITSMMHPHPDDHPKLRRRLFYGELPGTASVMRATKHVLGARGLKDGWKESVPPLAYAMLLTGDQVPRHWFPDPYSDGGSDRDSMSPFDGVSEDDAYRPGITCNVLQDTETSSCDEDLLRVPQHRLRVLQIGHKLSIAERKLFKDFDSYVKTYHLGRRIRRTGRLARREKRREVAFEEHKSSRRATEESRRQEELKCGLEAVHQYMVRWHWQIDKSRNDKTLQQIGRQLARVQKMDIDQLIEECRAQAVVDQLVKLRLLYVRLSLRTNVFQKWMYLCRARITDPPLNLYCWMSSIRITGQPTNDCCGLKIMDSVQPLTLYDVAVGNSAEDENHGYRNNNDEEDTVGEEVWKLFQQNLLKFNDDVYKKKRKSANIKQKENPVECSNQTDSLQKMAFWAMAHQADKYKTSIIKAVKLDKNLGDFGDLAQAARRGQPKDDSVHLCPHKLIKELMHGSLALICLDVHSVEKVPVMTKGKDLHWAILCGVIIGRVYNQAEKKPRTCTSSAFKNYPDEKIIINKEDVTQYEINTYKIDKHWNDDMKDYCLCEIGHLNVKMKYAWVIVKHGGLSGHYDVWPLLDVIKSNEQIADQGMQNPHSLSAKRYVLLQPRRESKLVSNYVNCNKSYFGIDPLVPPLWFFSMKSQVVPYKPIPVIGPELKPESGDKTKSGRTGLLYMPDKQRFWHLRQTRSHLRYQRFRSRLMNRTKSDSSRDSSPEERPSNNRPQKIWPWRMIPYMKPTTSKIDSTPYGPEMATRVIKRNRRPRSTATRTLSYSSEDSSTISRVRRQRRPTPNFSLSSNNAPEIAGCSTSGNRRPFEGKKIDCINIRHSSTGSSTDSSSDLLTDTPNPVQTARSQQLTRKTQKMKSRIPTTGNPVLSQSQSSVFSGNPMEETKEVCDTLLRFSMEGRVNSDPSGNPMGSKELSATLLNLESQSSEVTNVIPSQIQGSEPSNISMVSDDEQRPTAPIITNQNSEFANMIPSLNQSPRLSDISMDSEDGRVGLMNLELIGSQSSGSSDSEMSMSQSDGSSDEAQSQSQSSRLLKSVSLSGQSSGSSNSVNSQSQNSGSSDSVKSRSQSSGSSDSVKSRSHGSGPSDSVKSRSQGSVSSNSVKSRSQGSVSSNSVKSRSQDSGSSNSVKSRSQGSGSSESVKSRSQGSGSSNSVKSRSQNSGSSNSVKSLSQSSGSSIRPVRSHGRRFRSSGNPFRPQILSSTSSDDSSQSQIQSSRCSDNPLRPQFQNDQEVKSYITSMLDDITMLISSDSDD